MYNIKDIWCAGCKKNINEIMEFSFIYSAQYYKENSREEEYHDALEHTFQSGIALKHDWFHSEDCYEQHLWK